MEFTFINVVLLIAMVAVSILLGFYYGNRHGYTIGSVDGMFNGENHIKQFLTKDELANVEKRERQAAEKILRKIFEDN